MVSWFPHIVFPTLLALSFLRKLPRTWVMWLAPVVFVPDLDTLVPGAHRVWTHTLLLPAALLGAVWLLNRKATPALPFWRFAVTPGWPLGLTLGAYYLASHIVMDVFASGVVLFWPLLNTNFYLDFAIYIDLVNGRLLPQAEAGVTEGPFGLDPAYPWFTYEHSAMLAFMLCFALIGLGVLARRRQRAKRESPPTTQAARKK